MQCLERELPDTDEYLSQFLLMARRERIPLSGSLDLTYKCNLRCIHCYLGPQTEREKLGGGEVGTGRFLSFIDEVAEAGCLNLLISGGEPLLRADFPEIYRHAKEKGLLVTVFSNGTLITEKLVELFIELPPLEVEISLYGATAQTYEKVTRVPGSYERCLRGIGRLRDSGVKVNLKTILMTVNSHELPAMEKIAREFAVRFRFDAAISPCLGGDKTPLGLRVHPEKAIEMEFADGKRLHQWEKFFEQSREHILEDTLYGCGAGVTSFHIDPNGFLRPCMMTRDVKYDLSGGGFLTGWHEIGSRLRVKKASSEFACRGCEKINLCGYCPAFFRLENGTEDTRSEYICEMGKLRYQRITQRYSKGAENDKETETSLQAAL